MNLKNKNKAIVIFGDTFTFPEGNAATNRVHTFAKGFLENSLNAFVICFRNEYTENIEGVFEGIGYYYPYGQKVRSKSFLTRRWVKIKKYFRTYRLLRDISKGNDILAINLWTNTLRTQLLVFFLGRLLGAMVIHEHSEHPLREFQRPFLRKLWGECKSFLGTMLCDGIFCISEYLKGFYRGRGVRESKVLIVPSTVDTSRFKDARPSPLPFKYILYCGSLTIKKDGVDILIDSFNRISDETPDLDLVLIGKGDTPVEEISIRKQVEQLNLGSRIHFLGQMSRTEVPVYMSGAAILALARPKSIVADAGFPSKLTEYLSTGKPVVVTSVGEIPYYLKDRENAIISRPDDVKDFADQLRFVMSNYDFALTVGSKGKELAETVFNYKVQATRMLDFIKCLKEH